MAYVPLDFSPSFKDASPFWNTMISHTVEEACMDSTLTGRVAWAFPSFLNPCGSSYPRHAAYYFRHLRFTCAVVRFDDAYLDRTSVDDKHVSLRAG